MSSWAALKEHIAAAVAEHGRALAQDDRRKKSLIAVHAEDDRGRRYLASYDRSTSAPRSEEPAGEPAMKREELIARTGAPGRTRHANEFRSPAGR